MSFLYLSLAGEELLACYRVDGETGDLEHLRNQPVPGAPSVQGRHCRLPVLYAAMRSNGRLVSFGIDGASGRLAHLHTIDTGLEDPGYLLTDRGGRWLLTPYYVSGKVTVYPVGGDGAAREPASCVFDTDLHAHGLALDPGNRFLFVPHTCPGDAVFQLRFAGGMLGANDPPKVTAGTGLGPRHVHFHPNGRWLYAGNEQGNSVTQYRFDEGRGTLSPLRTTTTLPSGFSGGATARMLIHPGGRFLYAANRGHDSIACFGIPETTGELEPRGHAATPETPRSFDIEPSGRFLYAAGESADLLAQYRIDGEAGTLEPVRSYETGKVPWWVQVVDPEGGS